MQRRYDESVAQYKKAMEVDPTFIFSLTGLGDCYTFKGEHAKAREYYQAYVDKSPQINQKINGEYLKAVSFVHEGKIPEAIKVFGEYGAFAQKEGQYSSAVYALANQGYVLSSFGKVAEGLKKVEEAIQLAKTAPLRPHIRENILFWSNYWLSFHNAEAKKPAVAQEYLAVFAKDVTRRGNPEEKDALTTGEGHLALLAGKYDEALAKLTSVPPEPTSLYLQALTYAKKGDKVNAKKVAEKTMKWNTNSLELAIARSKVKGWL
jgi:tetratricopeptide (TPR) repeat protein